MTISRLGLRRDPDDDKMAHIVFTNENEVCAYNGNGNIFFKSRTDAALLSAA